MHWWTIGILLVGGCVIEPVGDPDLVADESSELVAPTYTCWGIEAGTCDGTCPPGEACVPRENPGGTYPGCKCVSAPPVLPPCGSATAPECNGTCPGTQSCESYEGFDGPACHCVGV